MIKKETLKSALESLGFTAHGKTYRKTINGYELAADFANEKLIYPADITAERDTTKNFSQNENFVVFECVHNLLDAGYKPEHITLEPKTVGGREDTSFYCDILIKNNDGEEYLLIECKTTDAKDSEFDKAWKRMQKDGGQLFNYFNSYRKAQYLCLYAADWANGRVEQSYRLVSMQDNDKYLESDSKLKSYQSVHESNGSRSEFFEVWKQTYQLDSTEKNLFESAPFHIGTRPFATTDLKEVDSVAIQKKYHQFATIMRQHNVSGRENAFDKLVNIFLAKIKDESENPNNLKVYWKGAAQDNYFDLQDRLQELYKKGMKEFLNEEITHVTNQDIIDSFKLYVGDKDATKRAVLEQFKEIKYYTNNDFAFLDVHNRPLFFKNGAILKEVVQMLQDIKLKTDGSGQNQFLGDLFEGFLDQGVKQSEGQFFTPMPIVRFLVSSLPLENLIANSESVPKMIDYACGAGHFLNEYATQIRPLVEQHKNAAPAPYYAATYGVEKEYRLSKVAKVSAFMYGQDGINIVYGDGLTGHADIQNGEFSVLVANPPYSVKGFLDTLSEDEREAFSLYQNVKETDTFNSIETFFIERAAQLLQQGGVAAIILPSSVLSNGNIYIKTREILLQRFDIVAIAEFGSGTFGKTGTNTVTLFLRRKSDAPSLAEHYQNRVDFWFGGDHQADELFADRALLTRYCAHCGIAESEYLDFLQNQRLPENGIFADYRAEYQKSNDWKAIQKKRDFQKKSADEKQDELERRAFAFAAEIEKDKLRHFMLAAANPQPVLIIKSPSENKAAKQFLGYEWSTRKGSEGIKYIGGGEAEDEDNPNRNQGIFKIQTPLFNPNDLSDSSKLNHLIRQNFQAASKQMQPEIPEHLQAFASLRPLHEMLDFSRTEFDKAVQTEIKEKFVIISKYPLIKLGSFCEIQKGKSITQKQTKEGNIKVVAGGTDYAYLHNEHNRDENIITISASGANAGYVNFWKEKIFASDCTTVRARTLTETIFVFNYLKSIQNILFSFAKGAAQPHVYPDDIKNLDIPDIDKELQEKIVDECNILDQEYETSRMSIEAYRAKIAKIFSDLEVMAQNQSGGIKLFKIKELCSLLKRGKFPVYGNSSIQVIASGQARGYLNFDFSHPKFASKNFVLDERKLKKGDVLINSTGTGTAGRVTLFELDGDFVADNHITIFRTNEKIYPKFALYSLASIGFKNLEAMAQGASKQKELSITTIQNISLLVPSLAEQQTILAQIAEYEAEIAKLEQNLQDLPKRKQSVLDKYLN